MCPYLAGLLYNVLMHEVYKLICYVLVYYIY